MPRANRVVVVGSSNISAQQMSDFWRKAGDGTFDGDDFQSFLDSPKRFSKSIMTLTRATKILGANKVITAADAGKSWNLTASAAIRYSETTLKQAAKENQTSQTDWRLVFCLGNSLRHQRNTCGTDTAKQPCFCKDNTWWLDSKEDGWATHQNQPGYYLIDFNGRWGTLTWDAQEAELRKLGSLYERANPAVFGEAILTNFLVNKKQIAENWYHWSGVAASDGSFVCVGRLLAVGLSVNRSLRGDSDSDLRVCLFRKFDA